MAKVLKTIPLEIEENEKIKEIASKYKVSGNTLVKKAIKRLIESAPSDVEEALKN